MGQPAAKQGDQVIATDIHIVMIPSPGGPIPTPASEPVHRPARRRARERREDRGKAGRDEGLDGDQHALAHPAGGPFQTPPSNKATIFMGSATVMIDGKAAARNGDIAMTCNDPSDLPVGQVVAVSTVLIGG